ncbi:uncharacterized protein LOC142162280 [Nicotiana tabacum]|uniref:Uncharacterized protein LOC142162280 n=1 Tax=Nicotiana tabacum TaxID=4097 RepID=A0AC58RPP9_TOBAC
MKDLCDEMNLMVAGVGCECEETKPFLDQFKNLHLLQFLVGLNESYSHVRSEILLKTPVLTVNKAYALAVQEKSQCTLSVVNLDKEPLTMLAGRGQCYPQDFKSKTKYQNSGVKGYANVSAGEGGSSNTPGHYFTEDPYKQLLGLLNKPDPDTGDCYTLMADFCVFQGLYSGKVLGIGKEHNGLYLLKKELNKEFPAIIGSVVQMQEDSALWYMRLGHLSTVIMQHIPLLKNKVDTKLQHSCEICLLAKQNRLPLQLSTTLYQKGDKFAPRFRRAVMIGYSETQKEYILYDLESRTFLVSMDVIFREQNFLLKE